MIRGIIQRPPKQAGNGLNMGDAGILKKRYLRATQFNAEQQLANTKMRKLLDEKNNEIQSLMFFRNTCYDLYQKNLMTEQCELIRKSGGKVPDELVNQLKQMGSPDAKGLEVGKTDSMREIAKQFNMSDLSMKSNNTNLKQTQSQTQHEGDTALEAPAAEQDETPAEDDGQIVS
jgi:hypothetical protein